MAQAVEPDQQFELHLLPLERDHVPVSRLVVLGLGSLGVHVVLGLALAALPVVVPNYQQAPEITVDLKKAVPLVYPRYQELTQKAPNIGKVSKELDVRSSVQASQAQAPRFRPPAPTPAPRDLAPAPAIEAPKVEVAVATPMPVVPPAIPQVPAPDNTPEKPRIVFEKVGAGNGPNPSSNVKITLPNPAAPVQELARAAPPRPAIGGLMVGDSGDDLSIAGAASSDGRPKSNLQLLSDPEGVDFKPYLVQILAAVRHNWLSVIPESARLGRRGNVLIQFSIDRKGAVPKLVIASPSGTDALDRAAVAGVSMSNPFPPLPTEFKGDQIRLQLAFSYNVRK